MALIERLSEKGQNTIYIDPPVTTRDGEVDRCEKNQCGPPIEFGLR